MKYFLKLIRLLPRLILRKVREVIRALGYRKPSSSYYLVALSGATMVWTPRGNIVLDPKTTRKLGNHLVRMADIADGL